MKTFFTLVLLLAVFLQPSTPVVKAGVSSPVNELQLIAKINDLRVDHNLPKLTANHLLSASALEKSNDIIDNDYWAHDSPNGLTFEHLMMRSGYKYSSAGENLAFGYETTDAVLTSWINSPSHLNTLLNPNYRHIGVSAEVGNYQGVEGINVVTAHFAAPKGTQVLGAFLNLARPECAAQFLSQSFDETIHFLRSKCLVDVPNVQTESNSTSGIFTPVYLRSAKFI